MERLQIIIASYFKYFGEEVAEILDTFSGVDQRRITHVFMDIIEGDLYQTDEEGVTELTITVAEDVSFPVLIFVKLYCMDKEIADELKRVKEWTLSVNKR